MDVGQWIVIILSAILGVWFFIGSVFNRRKGMQVFSWLSKGLEAFGKLSEAKWIGSSGSGARLVIGQAKAPFQRIEVIFLLESREILPLWIFNHLRGKRDEMIIKAGLRAAPSIELEAAQGNDREFQAILSNAAKKPYELITDPGDFDVAWRGTPDNMNLDAFKALLGAYPQALMRFSLQRKAPHLIVRARLPTLQPDPAEKFLRSIERVL